MCDHGTYDYAWDESIRDAVDPLKAELDVLKQRFEKLEALLLEIRKILVSVT